MTLKHWTANLSSSPLGFSRSELAHTLLVNRCVTNATLVVGWGIGIISAWGFSADVFKIMTSGAPDASPSLTVVAMIAVRAIVSLGSVHYLWRCYRTGQSDVRKLHRQMTRLDILDQEFRSGQRRPAEKRRTRAAGTRQNVERPRDVESSTPAATPHSDNVVPFDPNRR